MHRHALELLKNTHINSSKVKMQFLIPQLPIGGFLGFPNAHGPSRLSKQNAGLQHKAFQS